MLIDFLRAADGTPLTKKFTKAADGTIDVEPFPNVRDFDSFREEASSIEELFTHITTHAAQKHCMIKGRLARPLKNESRAGMTDPHSPTQWLLLDLDFDSGWPNVDEFLAELNPAWSDVSYIWQHSSSAGIKATPGLRGHIWLMLETAIVPASIKLWLKSRNLEMPGLRQHMTLTATGLSPRWPLDISTCQNDKLIYIAPPMLVGLEDPLPDRIHLVRRTKDFAPAPALAGLHPQAVDVQQDAVVSELRRAANLPPRKAKYTTHQDLPLLTNPSPATVTGVKQGRDFVYLNLNGGDSWGYYHHIDNPDLLYNFKDEPLVRLQTIAPEYLSDYRRKLKHERFNDVQPYVFRNPQTDKYWNLLYSWKEDRILFQHPVATKDRMKDFMTLYGGDLPAPIEDWTVEFDPTTTNVFDDSKRWINSFEPTDFLKLGKDISICSEIPPITDKIINSVVAECPVTKEAFVNWLACLVQGREHLGTAWILHGVPGTGKGLLIQKILTPILGTKQVTNWTTKEFEDPFNTNLEHTCLLCLDEFKAASGRSKDSLMSRLKHLVTEPTLPIRAMHQATIERPNYVNVIITTNFSDPILLTSDDRRFNVAPPQEQTLQITTSEVDALSDETGLFASYLIHYPADFDKARKVLLLEAREQMIESSQSLVDSFFSAVRKGDFDYFHSCVNDEPLSGQPFSHYECSLAVNRWGYAFVDEQNTAVRCSNNELRAVFEHASGRRLGKKEFAILAGKHRLPMDEMRINGRPARGREIKFKSKNLETLREVLTMQKDRSLKVIPGGKTD